LIIEKNKGPFSLVHFIKPWKAPIVKNQPDGGPN